MLLSRLKNDTMMNSCYSGDLTLVDLIDVNFLLEMMSDETEKAIQKFIKYTNDMSEHKCLDIDDQAKQRTRDEEARRVIIKVTGIFYPFSYIKWIHLLM